MLTTSQKTSYLLHCVLHYADKVSCPSCGSNDAVLIDRKYLVARLFECQNCKLYFRHPSDSIKENLDFYQDAYTEADDITTYLPPKEELEQLKSVNFSTTRDRSAERLKQLFQCLFEKLEGVKIIDYGSSWGYLSYQFQSYGMDVESFEISVPRASFGNQSLGLNIRTHEASLRSGNDIFFSSHVIEHVPSVSKMLAVGERLLTEDGYLITICPNGSPQYRTREPRGFHAAWGKVHPSYLNVEFFKNNYSAKPYFITTAPFNFEKIKAWDKHSQNVDEQLTGVELLVICRPNY
ncbi:MAG: class I SAM-dependent methyltransferase [Saprospiraceae bacterium]